MIIGIALVIDESQKGPRLVFRYPWSVPSNILNSYEDLNQLHRDYLSISSEQFAKFFRPKNSLINKISEVTIDDLTFVSYPCVCTRDEILTTISPDELQTVSISLFTIVITIVRQHVMKKLERKYYCKDHESGTLHKGSTGSLQDPLALVLGLEYLSVSNQEVKRVVELVSRSLLREERRHLYVTKQVGIMISNDQNDIDENQKVELMMKQSTLANEFREIYHGLIGGYAVNVMINDYIPLHIQLYQKLSSFKIDNMEQKSNFIQNMSLISLIDIHFLESQRCNIANKDHAKLLLELANPMQSLEKIIQTTHISLDSICDLVLYLESHGIVMIIPTLSYSSVFYVVDTINIDVMNTESRYSKVSHLFFNKFQSQIKEHLKENIPKAALEGNCDVLDFDDCKFVLFQILSIFNGNRNFRVAISQFPNKLSPFAIDIVVWLLKYKILAISNSN